MSEDPIVSTAKARIAALGDAVDPEYPAADFEGSVLDAMDAHVAVLDREGRILAVNRAWRRFAEANAAPGQIFPANVGEGANYLDVCLAASRSGDEAATAALDGILDVLRGERSRFDLEYPCDAPGVKRWFILKVAMLPGSASKIVLWHVDITARKQAEEISADQSLILERVATGAPLGAVLEHVASAVERHLPGVLCSILLLDPDGVHLRSGAGGSLPAECNAAIDGVAIGPGVGSCGTAAYRGEPVVVSDIAVDPLWDDYRDLALRHGLRACWSFPILPSRRDDDNASRSVLGTFAVYRREPGRPDPAAERVAAWAAHLAAIAIDAHRTTRALRASQRHFRELTENMPQLVWTCALEGGCDYLSPQWIRYTGIPADEQLGEGWLAQLHPDDRHRVITAWNETVAVGASFEAEFRIRRADGVYRWFSTRAVPLRDADGTLIKWFGTNSDIDDRRRAEQAVRASEIRMRNLLDNLYAFVCLLETDGTIVYVNNAQLETAGLTLADVVGKKFWECPSFAGDDATVVAVLAAVERAAAGEPTRGDLTVRLAGGPRLILDLQVAALRNEQGEIVHLIGCAVDVTDREAAVAELRLRDRAIQAVSQGILITDATRPDNPIVYASPAFERLTGYAASEVIGRSSRFLQGEGTDPSAVDAVRAAIREGRGVAVELLNRRKDGSAFRNALTVAPILEGDRVTHYVGVQTDVTEQRTLEAQYRHAQKMDAFGQLAGGVAHDFNNILTIINGEVELLMEGFPATDKRSESLAAIFDAGRRAASLTAQLLAFTRKTIVEPKLLDPNAVVQQIGQLLRRLLGEDITLATDPGVQVSPVKMDPSQIEQVIMNLALNARDAMPLGGRLTIETRNVDLTAEDLRADANCRPGRFVRLSVSDTGIGMSEETKARIFEPFFTTKDVGKGTGLGLATVYGIVRSYGGSVRVWSEVGHGTTFTLFVPAALEAEIPGIAEHAKEAPTRGEETVLLVEDEPAVRRVARIALESQGYQVLEADGGVEAIRLADQFPGPIHLMLTDVVMPGIGGREAANHVLARHPEARVLYMSGYTDDAVVRNGVIEATDAFLQKPFSLSALTRKVRALLDGTG